MSRTVQVGAGLLLLTVALSGCKKATPGSKFRRINDQEIVKTEEGRKFTKYLASCALAEGDGVYAELDGKRYDFPGSMGLAPEWIRRPLDEKEKRWVSACILGRTNFFGVTVQISMRSEQSTAQFLSASEQEKKDYPIYEGDFFGNLFTDKKPAGVCLGSRTPEQEQAKIFMRRVCTQAGDKELLGKKLSRCNMIITGPCSAPDAHTIDGVQYSEFIRVYLKPE